jgi:hypothetical protein
MGRAAIALLPVVLAACAAEREREEPMSWYDPGSTYAVEEPIAFTDTPYGWTGETAIRDVPTPDRFETWFAPDDQPPGDECADWRTVDSLPVEVEGVVTIHPRYYFKTSGCRPEDDQSIDSDEKYYGSYFIEDDSGGYFVLGDSKVAHFDMGARVKLKVRATKEAFGLRMIAAHDVLEVDYGPTPIYFEERTEPLTSDDSYEVRRMTGTVGFTGDFGEVQLCLGDVRDGDFDDVNAGDDRSDPQIRCISEGRGFYAIIDSELQRRGLELAVGERVQATGPVLYSFDQYRIVLTRIGQIEWLDAAE